MLGLPWVCAIAGSSRADIWCHDVVFRTEMLAEAAHATSFEPKPCSLCGTSLVARWRGDVEFNVYDCPACGLGVTWPVPAEANGDEVWADDDGHYERQFSRHRDLWRSFGEALLEHIPPSHRTGRLLDVGSGVGLLVELAAERGATAFGIDRAPAAGRVARRHGIDVRTGELTDLQERDFDVVVMMHVLEHVYDPVGFVKEAAARLREGGLLLVNVPTADGLMPRLLRRRWYGFQPTQHVHQFSRRALRQIAPQAGLGPLRVTSESLHYAHPAMLIRTALVATATVGRLLRLGDQSTLLARKCSPAGWPGREGLDEQVERLVSES
jgi:SAM-dependent methyltransferase